ncbi:MAG: hypothetical protein M0Q22_01000 [Sulfuritalea sp.]|nr:hypothetical protein [Sulfuritalea sp.]
MVELIVTMVIIGIMAVVVLPRFDLLKGFDEIGYRDKVKATLEYARKSAVAGRRLTVFAIATGSPPCASATQPCLMVERATATPEGECTTAPCNLQALVLPGSSTNVVNAPTGITVAGPTSIVFDALGRPSGTANCPTASPVNYCYTVTGSSAETITVEAETGYVH